MTKSELKMIFYLLQGRENVGKTFRQMASESGMSLGSVQQNFQQLAAAGYILDTPKGKVLRRRSQLIDRWSRGYAEELKARQLLQRFTFLTPQVRASWQQVSIPQGCHWSGEAAAILEGFISPQRWDLYVPESANALIATGRMIPDPDGEIFVHRRFWQTDSIPLLVVYADLLATGDDRCAEAAERIKSLI